MYSFSYLEPVCCSMSSSNFCFLTCIQVSQEAGQVVWYSHLFQNFTQFTVIRTVKGFGIVNKAEIDVFLELSRFFESSQGDLMMSWAWQWLPQLLEWRGQHRLRAHTAPLERDCAGQTSRAERSSEKNLAFLGGLVSYRRVLWLFN